MKKIAFRIVVFFFFFSALFISCNQNYESKIFHADTIVTALPNDQSIAGSFIPQTSLVFDSIFITTFLDSFPRFQSLKRELDTFYNKRNYSFAWFNKNGLIEPADNLFNHVLNIREEGLSDSVAYKSQFISLMDMEGSNTKPSAFLDLMLTVQYLNYAKTAWEGVSRKKMTELEWMIPRKESSYEELLDSLLGGKDLLKNAPVYRQYSLLKDYLKKYNVIKMSGGWEMIKADKKSYKPGDSSIVVAKIRERLFVTGDIGENNKSRLYDSTFTVAVKKFEKRYGYKEDGILTAPLIAEMNVPVEERIKQIIVNLERSRWVPIQLNTEYLLINIPDYKLYVFEKDTPVWNMNVVVGKDQHRTVIFNGDMKYIVFSPYWNIPASIMKNEVLPAIKRNPNYLASHNMEWNGGSVRQKPGPNNSLGLVKFLFPNTYNIYLHDSPAKSLFKEDQRAFSHGCIRLAEPKKLATYLLRNDSAWNEAKITAAMNKSVEQYVTLKKPMPVFIAYFTAWVDRQGNINFRKDIYKRDQHLLEMILDKREL